MARSGAQHGPQHTAAATAAALMLLLCCTRQAHVSYSALPQSDPNSLQQRLQQCADLVSQQQLPVAIQLLDDVIEWQLEDFVGIDLSNYSSSSSTVAQLLQQVVNSGAAAGCPASPYLVPACVYAVLLDLFDPATQAISRRRRDTISNSSTAGSTAGSTAAAEATASSTEASRANSPSSTAADEVDDDDMFDAVGSIPTPGSSRSVSPALTRRSIVTDQDSPLQRLAKFQLEQLEKAAPADALAPAAVCLRLLLGRKHPVAAAMQLLAERNMSPGARQARALRQQQKQLAVATELLQVRVSAACCWMVTQYSQYQLAVPARKFLRHCCWCLFPEHNPCDAADVPLMLPAWSCFVAASMCHV